MNSPLKLGLIAELKPIPLSSIYKVALVLVLLALFFGYITISSEGEDFLEEQKNNVQDMLDD